MGALREIEIASLKSKIERMEAALKALLALWEAYQESDLSQMNAHDCLVRYEAWGAAREALE